MRNCILTIDLGSTNFKFSLFDADTMTAIRTLSRPVVYIESNRMVEFDAEAYVRECLDGIKAIMHNSGIGKSSLKVISFTGQAESFVLMDSQGQVIGNAISWKDERSDLQCESIASKFTEVEWYDRTGLPHISTTWPVTKLLWLRENHPAEFSRIQRLFLIKDYVIYRFSGKFVSDYTVFSFSGMLELAQKRFWGEMLDYLQLDPVILPELVEPGSIVGTISKTAAAYIGLDEGTKICIGALDHVTGLIGTGNLGYNSINISTGTVQALATNVPEFICDKRKIECHYGASPNSFIQLLVIESGGICLQWFKDQFLPSYSFQQIDHMVAERQSNDSKLVFLPYICGVNPPEYDNTAKGVFYGFDVHSDKWDFAKAIMEANGFLLRKSIEFMMPAEKGFSNIYSIGGGSHSLQFCSLIADVIRKPIITFKNSESASLGAAILGAVSSGFYKNIEECVEKSVIIDKIIEPDTTHEYEEKYQKFNELYQRLFTTHTGE